MNLLRKLTVQDIVEFEEVSITSARITLKEIKRYTELDKPRIWHYFIYYKIDYTEYCSWSKTSLIG